MTVRSCRVPHLFQDVQEYQITTAVCVPVPPLCRSVPRECFLEKENQGLGTADSCAFNSGACLENVCGCCAACAGRLLLLLLLFSLQQTLTVLRLFESLPVSLPILAITL